MEPDDAAVFAAVAEHLADVVLVIGDDSTVLWRHRATNRELPMSIPVPTDEEVVGTRLVDRIHPDDLPVVLDGIDRLRAGDLSEFSLPVRIFDAKDTTLLHDADVRGIDARDIPGVGGVLVMAQVQDSRRAFPDQVHGDDFSLADAAPVGLGIIAADGRIVYANGMLRRQLGLGDRTTISVTAVAGLNELVNHARDEGTAEQTLESKGLTLRTAVRRFGSGDHVVVSTDDITDELEAIRARYRSEQTLRATFDHTPAGIALASPVGAFVEVNRAWTSITGYTQGELLGQHTNDLVHHDDRDIDRDYIDELRRGERDSYRIEKRVTHRTGQVIWVDLWVSLVRDADDEPMHLVLQILDITEAKQVEAAMRARQRQLTHDATHDHLTGMPNRALLEEHLRVAIARADRSDGRATVLAIDLDHFKPVNDRFGHACGDAALVELAERMTATCRRGDVIGRMGGDEFVAIAGPAGDDDDGTRLAERLLLVIAQELRSTPEPCHVTASIGVTHVRPDDTVESALERADAASYAAKRDGGDAVVADRAHTG